MNKTQLILTLARKTSLAQETVGRVVDALFDEGGVLQEELLAGRSVAIRGFGTFEAQRRRPRMAQNIGARETIVLPATSVPAFRPADAFRERMRG